MLQETHSDKKLEKFWTNEWGGRTFFSHGETNAKGVAILIHPSYAGKILDSKGDLEGRWQKITVQENEFNITIFNIYAPNKNSPDFFKEIEMEIRENTNNNIMLMGDFNFTFDNDLDRLNTYHNNNKMKEFVQGVMSEYMLDDLWRIRHETEKAYSWYKHSDHDQTVKASRIDHCLATPGIRESLHDIYFLNSEQSDHRALMAVFEIKSRDRGPGYWKLNSSILDDPSMSYKNRTKFNKRPCLFVGQKPNRKMGKIKRTYQSYMC